MSLKVDDAHSPFDEVRRAAVQEYAARQADLRTAGEAWVERVTSLLDEAGINYLSVTGRIKSVTSFAAKATQMRNGVHVYSDPLAEITDQVGVRVITYLHSDVAAVAELLDGEFEVLVDRDMGQETASEGRFGYSSRHVLVAELDDHGGLDEQIPAASVQVRTILQHAWAEFEHDIRYKGTIPEADVPDLDRRFTLAAGLLELADREFSEIRSRLQQGIEAPAAARSIDDDPRISPQELAAFLAGHYPDAGWSRTDHYEWISRLLLELGIASLHELDGILAGADTAHLNELMDYKYPPGQVRRLDDALLLAFGNDYVGLRLNAHRTAMLEARLEKMR